MVLVAALALASQFGQWQATGHGPIGPPGGTVEIAPSTTGAATLAGAALPVFSGTIATGDCVKWASATSITDAGAACGSGGGSSAFSALTGGTNATAAMTSATTLGGIESAA
ncbi:MAG: hypothetical protein ACRD2D_08630, partial [Terriglobales bacterium]